MNGSISEFEFSGCISTTILNCYIAMFSNFGGKKHSPMIHSLAVYWILWTLTFHKISKAKSTEFLIFVEVLLAFNLLSARSVDCQAIWAAKNIESRRYTTVSNNFTILQFFWNSNFIITEHISFLNNTLWLASSIWLRHSCTVSSNNHTLCFLLSITISCM